ncbi:hypothetical protein AB4266_07415 [Vibrio breoganii]|uniref:hypothetical protein n=1 Tax=Vibrio breoganii TaxID=553239 RepID=UPI000C85125C|nr:hypothetical protein [Vibrio breoganii]PMK56793.1 hypothetical protein BCT98_09165 [Vibrio breoganii]
MEKTDDIEKRNKLTDSTNAGALYQRCMMYVMKHHRGIPTYDTEAPETEAQDIAFALHHLMKGQNPFTANHKDHIQDMPEDWVHRMGAFLTTNNKKQVSELFNLQDDGKSLTQYLANKASDFLYDDQLEGLSDSKKLRKLIHLLDFYPQMKDYFCEMFEQYFDEWITEKQKVDVVFPRYSYEEWVAYATKK